MHRAKGNRLVRASVLPVCDNEFYCTLFCFSEDPPLLPLLSVLPLSMTNPSDVLDMPVDPNEPTYCLCHQVSYGEMIGCDNPDVSGFIQ